MQDESSSVSPHTTDESKSPPRPSRPPRLGEPSEHGPRWSGTQFQLRTIFLLITLIAAPLAWWGWRAMNTRRQQGVVEELTRFGAHAGWFRGHVVQVNFRGGRFRSEALTSLSKFPMLQRVVLIDTPVQLRDLQGLRSLKLKELKVLGTTRAASPETNSPLQLPRSLQSLWLEDAEISDQALKLLPDLPKLESLSLIGNPITDQSVAVLAKRQSVSQLLLHRTSMTKEGIDELRRELPKAIIYSN